MPERTELAMRAEAEMIKGRLNAAHTHTHNNGLRPTFQS